MCVVSESLLPFSEYVSNVSDVVLELGVTLNYWLRSSTSAGLKWQHQISTVRKKVRPDSADRNWTI